mmetsp:Transcript_86472/g.197278  ORF Transcript_86472/g.197278 Transcript_86472/m.197278 type:complete len:206 (+) Transcript_86472:2664-3281(+)
MSEVRLQVLHTVFEHFRCRFGLDRSVQHFEVGGAKPIPGFAKNAQHVILDSFVAVDFVSKRFKIGTQGQRELAEQLFVGPRPHLPPLLRFDAFYELCQLANIVVLTALQIGHRRHKIQHWQLCAPRRHGHPVGFFFGAQERRRHQGRRYHAHQILARSNCLLPSLPAPHVGASGSVFSERDHPTDVVACCDCLLMLFQPILRLLK